MNSVLLKDLCLENQCGIYGIPASAEEYHDSKTRYLRITDISDDGKLLENDKKSVSAKNIEKYILNEGDIVFARTGNSTGRAYYHENKNGKLAFAGFLIKYSLDSHKVNPKYIRYFTITKEYKQWVDNLSLGSTRGNINAQTFSSCPITLPSRKQQDLLVSILSTLDAKIELNNRINKELEAMAKTLYDYWFVQFDFPNKDAKPYKSSGGKMVYNEELKREIPEGWEVEELKKHISIERGLSYKSNELCDTGIPMINLNSFYLNGTYKPEGIKYFTGKYNSNKITKPEELIIATTDVTRNADIIGKAVIVPNIYEKDVVLSCDIAKVICKSSLDKFFLEKLFNSESYHNYIKGFASGTLVLHLNTDGIDWYKLCIPPKNILNKFSKFMKNIQKKKDLTIKENQHLTQLRDFLLPMLMNGQVSVKS